MSTLTQYIHRFSSVKVLVIGDIMLDRFLYGTVERISPEAPVPIFKAGTEKQMLGGAGNVVANLTDLGCQVMFIGIVGKDKDGLKISRLLSQCGAKHHLLKLNNYPTIVKTRIIAGNNHLLRADQEDILPFFENRMTQFKRILTRAVQNADIVLLSDYNKGILTPITTPVIIDICRHLNKKVIIDPKGNDYTKYTNAFLIKPNLKEFSEATGQKYNPIDPDFQQKIKAGATRLFSAYNIQNLLITLSEHGMIYVSSQNPNKLIQIPTQAKEVFDVSGAGDTSLATLGASIGAKANIHEAMTLANLASGIVVGKLGTATVSASELANVVSNIPVLVNKSAKNQTDHFSFPKQHPKIITLSQAKQIVESAKQQGLKIGFTNGCFDCCHLGHLNSFTETKKQCDILIVAMNADASVKRYKGPLRPLQDEKTRSTLLASLECIDYVIVFEDDSPIKIVETLKPDIIAKEGYPLDKWPEAQLVLKYGGQALTLKRIEGYATSNIIQKIKGEINANLSEQSI